MRASLQLATALLLPLLLSACVSAPPPLAFEHSTRVSVRRICVAPVGIPERAEVSIMNPIGAGFGVLGNLIETRREASASAEMADVLAKAHYEFGAALTNAVAIAMRKAGFTVSRGDGARPAKERERFLSQYPKRTLVDAYLDVYAPYVGFQALRSSAEYRPRIEIVARLVDTHGATLFQRRIIYGTASVEDEDALVVVGDDNVTFRDRDSLQANPSTTARALQGAIDSVAWELARQFM
jgi:hypothetical protein